MSQEAGPPAGCALVAAVLAAIAVLGLLAFLAAGLVDGVVR